MEYIMLLAGILVIVVIAIVLLRGMTTQTGNSAEVQACKTSLVADQKCYYQQGEAGVTLSQVGTWKYCGVVSEAKYKLCGAYNGLVPGVADCGISKTPGNPQDEIFCGLPPK
jgi:hypothetical protein